MYFLNGSRNFISPENNGTFESQFQNCLLQLSKFNSREKVFKMNLFIDSSSYDDYKEKQYEIHKHVQKRFGNDICLNVIAQPPVTAQIIMEAFFYDESSWNKEIIQNNICNAIHFKKEHTEFLIGFVQANNKEAISEQSEKAFRAIKEMLDEKEFHMQSIIRQWNYIEGITCLNDMHQHYQDFNEVRTKYYGDAFAGKGYPAATGIGMNEGGIIIEFIAMKSDEAATRPVDNPDQVPAHQYSKDVLEGYRTNKSTPKFERARYLNYAGRQMIFISGTASITGERIEGLNNPEKQTEVTIQNIQKLYAGDVLENICAGNVNPYYGHARIYVKNKQDYTIVRQVFERYYGRLPAIYIQADICRDGLLVEIEGEVILR